MQVQEACIGHLHVAAGLGASVVFTPAGHTSRVGRRLRGLINEAEYRSQAMQRTSYLTPL
eukprot:scaffold451_cov365-Prasinococcus_capsulatus_cf.AAC.21